MKTVRPYTMQMKSLTSQTWASYLFIFLSQMTIAISITTSKFLLHVMPIFPLLTLRFGSAAILLFLAHMLSKKGTLSFIKQLSLTDWAYISAQALSAGFIFNVLMVFGLERTSASLSGIIFSALPAIIVILSIIFLKERVKPKMLLGILFAMMGLCIINMQDLFHGATGQLMGDLAVFLSLFPEAAYYILTKMARDILPVFLLSAILSAMNAILFAICAIYHHQHVLIPHFSFYLPLCIFLGFTTALFYVFWSVGSKNIPTSASGLITALMPILTLILTFLFLGEKITFIQFWGMILVIISIFFSMT